jgi:hypothetical protein
MPKAIKETFIDEKKVDNYVHIQLCSTRPIQPSDIQELEKKGFSIFWRKHT